MNTRFSLSWSKSLLGRSFSYINTAVLCWCVAGGAAWGAGSVVVNEFHYNSKDNSSLEEFVELYNPGDAAYDLSGHRLDDAVFYEFPEGTVLPAGGYLVVAQQPQVLEAKYGITGVLGPWSGKLSSGGEEIEVRNALDTKVDSVKYRAGFPWPTMADGAGPSAELIHPLLDNGLGSSWRSSVPGEEVAYLPGMASGWRYFRGIDQAPSAGSQWRDPLFDDSSWEIGQAGFGYGYDTGNNTSLEDMYQSYTSVYLRRSFTIDGGSVPTSMKLRMRVDDGCVVWINGQEVARFHVPDGELGYDSAAINHEREEEEITLLGTDSYLVAGTNVVAVHALNTRVGSSDMAFDMSLSSTGAEEFPASPGAANRTSIALADAPPSVTSVSHAPASPTTGEPVEIAAAISDEDGMGAVRLEWQQVDPGSYIRLTDAAYETSWQSVPMTDGGDGVYRASLPGELQTHRRLMRYRIVATDALGNEQRFPYEDDEQPNFAYFVYDGVPEWTGALRPTAYAGADATEAVTYGVDVMASMPAIHLIADSGDVTNSQYNASFHKVRFRGTLIQKGVVYDHVEFRNRGQASTYVSGKNKWKIYFNRARDYQAYDNYGRPYRETWNELPINANASPWAAINRGSAGVEETSSHRLYALGGMAALNTQYFQFRVIDDVSEQGADQYSGDLWGLYMGFEPTEGNFIDEHDLQDGNLYSIEGNEGDKERQGPPPATADDSDWVAFRDGLAQSGQTEQWYRDHVDLDILYTFLAINRLIGNVDVRPGDNYRFYHRPSDGRWVIIAYDLDMMYIPAHHWGGTMDGVVVAGAPNVFRAIMRHPEIAREYRNRCREILSLVGSDSGAAGGQIGQLIAEYASFVNPVGQEKTWADIDAAMWNLHPRTEGNGANSGQSSHKGNFYRAVYHDSRGGLGGTLSSAWTRTLVDADSDGFSDHEGMMRYFVEYSTNAWDGGFWSRLAVNGVDPDPDRQLGYGYQYLQFEANYGGWGDANNNPGEEALHDDFPQKPTISALNPSFPVDDLAFRCSAFADPDGAQTHAATQWRIAQISAPGVPGFVAGEPWKYELDATWTSPEIAAGTSEFKFPLGLASAGNRYRVRVRHQDNSGNWSYWSEPITFDAVAAAPYTLLHYWNFNNSDEAPAFSMLGGSESAAGAVVYDDGGDFAALNARNGDSAGMHQRVNSPLTPGTELRFDLPTRGFGDVLIQYEARRSGSGAGIQLVDYTVDGGESWQRHSEVSVADIDGEAVPVIPLDFSRTPGAVDNPRFGIRITFLQGSGGTAGNNRFDNLTVEGRPVVPDFEAWRSRQFSVDELEDESISGGDADPTGAGMTNLMRHAAGLGRDDAVTDDNGYSLIQRIDPDDAPVYRFRYNPAATDLRWKVEAGAVPGSWTHVLFDSELTPAPTMKDGWVEIVLPDSLDGGSVRDPRMFVRLQILSTP
ncbi:lamin tail domain-containing protein [Sulfuriroseicoccus oceanibius]|uniref:Lamin tail domain-containing protein n=1 Tax=Sulfuriroseicoccus oceanibius TaxID=2707525 RepID=A0A6B3L2I8_9BACT|nr:lamin tail domain-containing protein [Sulfuriroseicoccus oceanibius]QQL46055.1 lamin tail domain-containing protein [Sulfuriroseicoccus oceanibius]